MNPTALPGTGIDTIARLNKDMFECLHTNGHSFVLKYLFAGSINKHKNWTSAELALCRDAGLRAGSIMQRKNNAVGNFDLATGKTHGKDAHTKASALGQPGETAIYFSVDFDASLKEFKSNIRPYFEGVADAFENAGSTYHIGAYGSALVLEELQSLSLISFAWLPGSTKWGFGRYKDYLASKNWHLHQSQLEIHLCKFEADVNDCLDLTGAGLFTPA